MSLSKVIIFLRSVAKTGGQEDAAKEIFTGHIKIHCKCIF